MRLSHRQWAWLILVPALGLLAGWASQYLQVESSQRYRGLQGEAAFNPLLAMQEWLQLRGHRVSALAQPDSALMAQADVLVIPAVSAALDNEQAQALLRQVQAGARLVISLNPRVDVQHNALWDILGWQVQEVDDVDWEQARQFVPLLLEFESEDYVLEIQPERILQAGDSTHPDLYERYRVEALYGPHLMLFEFGQGRIVLLSDSDWLENSRIDENDHAALFLQLLELQAEDAVMLVFGQLDASLSHFLWQRFAAFILIMSLLLLLWLWQRVPRFLPHQKAPLPLQRDLLEHLRQAARFQWRSYKQLPTIQASESDPGAHPRRRAEVLHWARQHQHRNHAQVKTHD